MSKRIDRRTFVRSALTAGAGVLLAPSAGWSAAQKARLATEGAFAQGVASGEPATNAVPLATTLAKPASRLTSPSTSAWAAPS